MTRFFDEESNESRFRDPCGDIEADVSALIDHELDQSGLRRVLLHLESCPNCRRFLDSIRAQVVLHQKSAREPASFDGLKDPFADHGLYGDAARTATASVDDGDVDLFDGVDLFADESGAGDPVDYLPAQGRPLRQVILEDVRERVGEVLYQLGRAYVCLARNPAMFRIIAREPVPVPEFRTRGKALLDGVANFKEDAIDRDAWTEARSLLDSDLDIVQKNYDKGRRLLEESLAIRPASNACRIHLAQVLTEQSEFAGALVLFEAVLADPKSERDCDVVTRVPYRIYALESLGNLQLWMNEDAAALRSFEAVRASGAMRVHPDFSSCLLNIAVASVRLRRHERAADALIECYSDFPERREALQRQLPLHQPLMQGLRADSSAWDRLRVGCPLWFAAEAKMPPSVDFHLHSYALGKNPSDHAGTDSPDDFGSEYPEARSRA